MDSQPLVEGLLYRERVNWRLQLAWVPVAVVTGSGGSTPQESHSYRVFPPGFWMEDDVIVTSLTGKQK